MGLNSYAVANAIADRFTGLTASSVNPATGATETETILIGPTALLPNDIAKGPALLVFHPIGVLEVGVSRMRRDELDYPVRLLRDPMDIPTRSRWLYAWIDALRDEVEKHLTLGGLVEWAHPVALEAEIDGFVFNTNPFDLVELMVRVHFKNESISTIAP
ncbi:MAG TPA: hypothetical protein VGQ89_09815 [Candidatus Limnocylindrales bacterium]|jgi:hypothetical protein|nr:hypothetical protein [Candidatus Limnocylindrales bacterium]